MTKQKPDSVDPVPEIPKPLLEWLEKSYPDRAIPITIPPREADVKLGKIELVRDLRELFRQQQETSRG